MADASRATLAAAIAFYFLPGLRDTEREGSETRVALGESAV